jgi:hypothetical protein
MCLLNSFVQPIGHCMQPADPFVQPIGIFG